MKTGQRAVERAVKNDLAKLKDRAFHRAEAAEGLLRRFHAIVARVKTADAARLHRLQAWIFVPLILWPFNVQDVLDACLAAAEKETPIDARYGLLIDLLPEPPAETVCAAVAEHEISIQKGVYENLIKTQAKYAQVELALRSDPELHHQWARLKTAFDVDAYRDHKGVIRRTMSAERNLRSSFSVNPARRGEVFRAAFDAFCLRWNLYGMQDDEPLLLKLAVTLTPFGTMIHIPTYWSFDPKRDIRWDAVARLHRVRVPKRQGAALTEGFAERLKAAKKLPGLDKEVLRMGLKGQKKHEFLCRGLGWDPRTSPRRISRLRQDFKQRSGAGKSE